MTGRFLVGVYKDPSSSLAVFAITRADSNKLLWFCSNRSLEGLTCQPNSVQPHARLSTKEVSCPCSGKAFLCGHNKTIQPTNRPASHSLYQLHQIWMLPMPVSHTTHHSAQPRILTKNSSLRCGGYMPEAGSSWTPTGLISQAAEGKRFVLAARWSHSTPPPV